MKNLPKILLAFSLLFFAFCANGQAWQWVSQAKGVDGWLCKKDLNNNVIIGGEWEIDSITLGTKTYVNYHFGPSINAETIIAKYDTIGNLKWSCASIGGQAWPIDLVIDNVGNTYFLGCFSTDSIMFGPYLLINNHLDSCLYCSYSVGCYFIVKLDTAGNVIWAKAGDNIHGHGGIAVDRASNIYITGTYWNSIIQIGPNVLHNSSYKKDEIFFAKYDSSGNVIWAKSFGGNFDDDATGLVQANDMIYLTGSFNSTTISFGSAMLTYQSSMPLDSLNVTFIAKFDTAGNNIWAKNSVGCSMPLAIAADHSNNIYVGGEIYDTSYVSFGLDTLKNYSLRWGGFIAKYNPQGDVTWIKGLFNKTQSITSAGFQGNKLYGITTDPCNNVWVCGSLSEDTGGVNIGGGISLHCPGGSIDPMYFIGYDSTGQLLQYLALPSGGDDNSALVSDNSGNIYVCSDTWKTLVFGSDSVVPIGGAGGETTFLAKYNPNLGCYLLNENIVVRNTDFPINIYPNPAQNQFTISYSNLPPQNTKAELYNITGQLVYNTSI